MCLMRQTGGTKKKKKRNAILIELEAAKKSDLSGKELNIRNEKEDDEEGAWRCSKEQLETEMMDVKL